VLDSGGLSALCGPSQRARTWLRWILENDGVLCVPTPVIVETTTGDGRRDAEINRILSVLTECGDILTAPDETTARLAAALRFRARTDDGIDALVAAAAALEATPTVLLTSDPDDLERLLSDVRHVVVRPIQRRSFL